MPVYLQQGTADVATRHEWLADFLHRKFRPIAESSAAVEGQSAARSRLLTYVEVSSPMPWSDRADLEPLPTRFALNLLPSRPHPFPSPLVASGGGRLSRPESRQGDAGAPEEDRGLAGREGQGDRGVWVALLMFFNRTPLCYKVASSLQNKIKMQLELSPPAGRPIHLQLYARGPTFPCACGPAVHESKTHSRWHSGP